ncbi:putative membrane protein [Methanohalophilus levihalophilus]|uniref:helix-turn-helix transcriptional regulator n=1 Tax=Methanohalophilus levihalophilus TaxID=1431282 RepID=UPI001AE24D51|nr:winged helix-turn-helix transcriptional regulator [Methanohalophilus levihalophilus]MBP2030518.1 putative membrane protein [Methanohalophilus levihalophilus]
MVSLKVVVISLLMLTALTPTMASSTATVHGAVYEWYSFELLDDAIIEINSTPPQTIVAKYGIYSLDLDNGTYKISAYYYEGENLESSTEEIITIDGDGDYVVDLLLQPVYENPFEETDNENLTASIEEETGFLAEETENSNYLYAILILILLSAFVAYGVYRKKKEADTKQASVGKETVIPNAFPEAEFMETAPNDSKSPNEEKDLPEDLKKIIDIIKSNGGRITQKELRQKVDYSEAKVSLMIADLENRGLVQKFKKGRGNIIVLS